MGSIEDRNYWQDRRVKVRDHQHEAWKLDEKRMVALVECPEFCPVHGEGEHDDHPECAVCRMVAKFEKRPELAREAEESREDAHAEGGPADDEFAVPFKWDVCGTCDGKGSMVNPSIDCGGLTSEDFDADPNFEESYRSGTYDVQCSECGGRRVVPKLTPSTADEKSIVKALDAEERQNAAWERESRAERAMGA